MKNKRILSLIATGLAAVSLALPGAAAEGERESHLLYSLPIGEEYFEGYQLLSLPMTEEEQAQVDAKVKEIVAAMNVDPAADMNKDGSVGEYEKAVWLHDWLIYHANYDYRYNDLPFDHPSFKASGVLLYGTGVCQSYAEAYELLLREAGIPDENQMLIEGPQMTPSHVWNLVKLDGEWCHIDVTWDDPNEGGGFENHNYFGLNDEMMGRDHRWEAGSYPEAKSTANLYVSRMGQDTVSGRESLDAYLREKVGAKVSGFELIYVGGDASFDLYNEIYSWFSKNAWEYGAYISSWGYAGYYMEVGLSYINPWAAPGALAKPVNGPAFDLTGPEGRYLSENYDGNGIVLVFGQDTNKRTAELLDILSESAADYREAGVEVIVNMMNWKDGTSLVGSETPEKYPELRFTYGSQALLNQVMGAIRLPRFDYPLVVIYNPDGKITFYDTGDMTEKGTKDALSDGISNAMPESPKALPNPEDVVYTAVNPVKGLDFTLSGTEGEVSYKKYAENGLLMIYGQTTCGNTQHLLQMLKQQMAELTSAGIEVIVNMINVTDRETLAAKKYDESHPGMIFTYNTDGNRGMFETLKLVGYTAESVNLPVVCVYDDKGNITYYSTGYIQNADDLLERAHLAANNPIVLTDAIIGLNGGERVTWALHADRTLEIADIPEGAYVNVAVYDDAGQMMEAAIFNTAEATVRLNEEGARFKIFLLNEKHIAQSVPTTVEFAAEK